MGWKSHKGVKAQRDETTKALKIKLSSSEASNLKVWKACYQELLADTPNDVYYSARIIKSFLALFIVLDRNLDGQLSLKEIKDLWKFENDKERAEFEEFFKEVDISGDQKLSLAEWFIIGFLKTDRENDYEFAYGGSQDPEVEDTKA